ncbi:MAG: hypothetical protein V4670_06205 [Bacteroidota bacterium]
MKKTLVLFFSMQLFSTIAYGQKVNEVLQKMNERFIAPKPLRFDTKYILYKDHKTKSVQQSYTGLFVKNNQNEVYLKIDKTEFINTKKVSLKINHGEKAMLISNKVEFSTGTFDVNKLIAYCTISSFKDYKTYWEIILTPKEYSGLNYTQIVLNIGKNYLLQKQVFFYNTGFNFSKDYRKQALDYPRLEIMYSGYNKKVTELSKINTNVFFTISQTNKVQATDKYKNYEVADKRTHLKNKSKATN